MNTRCKFIGLILLQPLIYSASNCYILHYRTPKCAMGTLGPGC